MGRYLRVMFLTEGHAIHVRSTHVHAQSGANCSSIGFEEPSAGPVPFANSDRLPIAHGFADRSLGVPLPSEREVDRPAPFGCVKRDDGKSFSYSFTIENRSAHIMRLRSLLGVPALLQALDSTGFEGFRCKLPMRS